MKLAEAEVMRKLDDSAINEYGIPGVVLMENAGRGTVDAIIKHFGALSGKVVSIIVGPGNNGGDGLVIARIILSRGGDPKVFLLGNPEKFKAAAKLNYEIVQKLPVEIQHLTNADTIRREIKQGTAIIDAIFGTGLERAVAGVYAEVIEAEKLVERSAKVGAAFMSSLGAFGIAVILFARLGILAAEPVVGHYRVRGVLGKDHQRFAACGWLGHDHANRVINDARVVRDDCPNRAIGIGASTVDGYTRAEVFTVA